jgi:hypothetical protein
MIVSLSFDNLEDYSMAINSTLKNLKLVALPKNASTADPVVMRRTAMVARLQEQIELLKDPNFKKTLKHRSKGDDGKTIWTESQHRVAPWWKEQADGSVVFSLMFQFKPLELAKGVNGVHVASLEKLPETITLLMTAVKAGELDAVLKAASDNSPMKGKTKTKK